MDRICTKCKIPKDLESCFTKCKRNVFGRNWYCKVCTREMFNNAHRNMRIRVLQKYGSVCSICREDNYEFLCIDHTNGGGRQHTIKIGGYPYLLRWLDKNPKMEGFRVLCQNHNQALQIEKQKIEVDLKDGKKYGNKYNRKNREIVLKHYGGKCECCKEDNPIFLAIDHISGGGGKHKKERNGYYIYSWIVVNNFPPDMFRILCHNCNCSLGHYGFCPHNKDFK